MTKPRYQQHIGLDEDQAKRVELLKEKDWKAVEIFMLGVSMAEEKSFQEKEVKK